jgi:hypothetical protein
VQVLAMTAGCSSKGDLLWALPEDVVADEVKAAE